MSLFLLTRIDKLVNVRVAVAFERGHSLQGIKDREPGDERRVLLMSVYIQIKGNEANGELTCEGKTTEIRSPRTAAIEYTQ